MMEVSKLKSLTSPPESLASIITSIAVVLGKNGTFETGKKELSNPSLIQTLINLDPSRLELSALYNIEGFTRQPEFTPQNVGIAFVAAAKFCAWVIAFSQLSRTLRDNEMCYDQSQASAFVPNYSPKWNN